VPALLTTLLLLLLSPASYGAGETPQAVHFGVLSIAPPARILARWQPFARYVSKHLNRPVKIIVPRGFGRMKNAVAQGQVDFFYVNSYVFYRLKQAGQATGVAQMVNLDGKTTSRSEMFVRSDSGIHDINDLKGKRIAYVSPMGAGGYLAPRAFLRSHGVKSGENIDEVFTRNLSSSIHKVLLKDIEAASMCGVNFRLMGEKVQTGELTVIAVSDAYPENLIAARSGLDPGLVERFAETVIRMADTPEGSEVLTDMASMKVKRFVPYDPSVEKITRAMLEQAGLPR